MTNLKLPRRKFLQIAAGAAALPAVSSIARAQSYPSRPVRIIVVAAAGGSPDILARIIGQRLTERLGQAFIIENRSGGGGTIGTEVVVRAPSDGHTLLLVAALHAINATLYDKLNYLGQDEFTLAAIAQNLRRLAKLMVRPPPATVACAA